MYVYQSHNTSLSQQETNLSEQKTTIDKNFTYKYSPLLLERDKDKALPPASRGSKGNLVEPGDSR